MNIKSILLLAMTTFSSNAFSYMWNTNIVDLECHTKNEGTIIKLVSPNPECGHRSGACGPIMKVKTGKAINFPTPNGKTELVTFQGPDTAWSPETAFGTVQFGIMVMGSFKPNDQFWAILNLDTCKITKALSPPLNINEDIKCSIVINEVDDTYYQHMTGPNSAWTGKYSDTNCITVR